MRINIINNQRKISDDTIKSLEPIWNNVVEKALEEDIFPFVLSKNSEIIYVNLTLVGTDKIRSMNKEHRNIDKVTDVLSFPMLDMKNGKFVSDIDTGDFEYDSEGNKVLCLGDIVICLEICQKQAAEFGHSFEREAAFLFAHSLLHLLGFDHIEKEDESVMIFWQKKLMYDIGMAFDDEIEFVDHNTEDKITSNIAFNAGSHCSHVGYVAILGRPNVGKSTLLNYITGMKLAIVSHKPQTTRTNIRSIYNGDDSQIIFVDTPGVHNPKSELSKIMVENSFSGAKHADIVLLMADGRFTEPASVEKKLLEMCAKNKKKVILAINKSDDISKESLLPTISNYSALYEFEDVVPISARTGDNIDVLLKTIENKLPEGPRLFDSEVMTTQTEREIAAELIREQILHYTNQEIPHGTTVVVDDFKEKFKDNAKDDYDREMVVIHASIICERKSHKAILLGKDGQMIKRISTKARINIERLTGCKVYLELFVKVREDWKNDDLYLKQYGYFVEEDD
ncbi:MAG: GTPase Era [Clostridiales bacterium]|nr:GTPase Era [Clostridiales bacterium]